MHLTKNGALVNVGQNVNQGADIGLSGVTGIASYPHLHFVITTNNWEYPSTILP